MSKQNPAAEIYGVIGGKANIITAENCMTRLRLVLKEQAEDLPGQLKAIPGVLGVNQTDTELQIILGPGKAGKVTAELQRLMSAEPGSELSDAAPAKAEPPTEAAKASAARIGDGEALHAEIRARNATPFKLLLKKIASIFMPIIPGFIACGLITGLLNILLKLSPDLAGTSLIQLLGIMGNAVFWGMNLFVGVNAAKTFGGTPILGGILAAVITHPALAKITLQDTPLLPGRGGIIAVLLVCALGAYLEKKLHQLIPEMFDLFLTPLLTILITGFAAIFILQPLGGTIATAIGTAAATAVNSGGALTGFILGGLWLPTVMAGLHQAMTPIHVQLLESTGVTILLPILAMGGSGQVGAAAAVYVKTKNAFLRKTIINAVPVGMMGIGEPLIYGVTLPLGRPFIGACLGGACGGAVQAYFAVGSTGLGISGLPLAAATDNAIIYLAGLLFSYVCGFIATWLLGFEDPPEGK